MKGIILILCFGLASCVSYEANLVLLRSVQNPEELLRRWIGSKQEQQNMTLCEKHVKLYSDKVRNLNFFGRKSSWALKSNQMPVKKFKINIFSYQCLIHLEKSQMELWLEWWYYLETFMNVWILK